MRKQRSTGELEKKVSGSIRSTASCTSWISTGSSQSAMGESYNTDSNASFIVEVRVGGRGVIILVCAVWPISAEKFNRSGGGR